MPEIFHVLTAEQTLRRYAVRAASAEEAAELAARALAADRPPGALVFQGLTDEQVLEAEPAP